MSVHDGPSFGVSLALNLTSPTSRESPPHTLVSLCVCACWLGRGVGQGSDAGYVTRWALVLAFARSHRTRDAFMDCRILESRSQGGHEDRAGSGVRGEVESVWKGVHWGLPALPTALRSNHLLSQALATTSLTLTNINITSTIALARETERKRVRWAEKGCSGRRGWSVGWKSAGVVETRVLIPLLKDGQFCVFFFAYSRF